MLGYWLEGIVRGAVRAELDLREADLRLLTGELRDVYQKLRMAEKRLWAIGKEGHNGLRMEVTKDLGDLDALLRERKGFK